MTHIVLIGDIVASRRIRRRDAFQETLKTHLRAISRASKKRLASPYTLTIGDEFQAVYHKAGGILDDILALKAALHPHEARFAISCGEITTRINPRQALEMDGPAFHAARAQIDTLRKTGNWIGFTGVLPAQTPLPGALVDILSTELDRWMPARIHILRRLLEETPVATIAQGIGISQSAVYRNIREGRLASWQTIIRETETLLAASLKSRHSRPRPRPRP